MTCQLQTIRLFDGLGNTDSMVFGYTDNAGVNQLFDFSSTTRFVLTLDDDTPIVLDTDVDATYITSLGDGELQFNFGHSPDISPGLYVGTLVIYTPAYPTGYNMDTGDGSTMMVDIR